MGVVGAAMFVLAPLMLAPGLGVVEDVFDGYTVTLQPGETGDVPIDDDALGTWAVYADLPGDPISALGAANADPGIAADIVVSGPAGNRVRLATPDERVPLVNVKLTTSASDPTWWSVATFPTQQVGRYQVTNNADVTVIVARETTEQFVGALGDVVPYGIGALLLVGAGVIIAVVGFILFLVGLLWRKPAA